MTNEDFKQDIIDGFFDRFLERTETLYWVWKGTNMKAGHLSENILTYILECVDKMEKYNK